jgi:hypothetical protein
MRALRTAALLLVLPLSFAGAATAAPAEDEDWKMMGGILSLMQQLVSLAVHSPDPEAAKKGMDDVLAGRNAQANRIAGDLMSEITADVPAEHRGAFVALGRDLLVLARREQARADAVGAPRPGAAPRVEDAIRARKALQAMGLRYWDEQQFLEAVRRGDRIAVDLYLLAQGLESQTGAPAKSPPPAR